MSDLPDELPSDPAELRAFAAVLLDRCAKLERLLKLANDARFGRSSEKLDADQLQLVWRTLMGPSRLSKRRKIVLVLKHARRELLSAEPIVANSRGICRALSKP
jgi:hypothetical protein